MQSTYKPASNYLKMKRNNDRLLSLMGLARRARQVKSGEGTVLGQIKSGRAYFVLLASDASAGTKKQFEDKCQSHGIELNEHYTRQQLSVAAGQNRSVFCICQQGFAKKFKELTQ